MTRFRAHIKKCADESSKVKPAAGMLFLLKLGWKKQKAPVTDQTMKDLPKETYSCPVLTELDNVQIPVYLKCTGFVGGGAWCHTKVYLVSRCHWNLICRMG